jgi:HK97 family phage major capsid protein
MSTDAKHVPRSGGVTVASVAKGAAYSEDTSANDEILLYARKFGTAVRIAEEDVDDTTGVPNLDILKIKKEDWANSYAVFIDNATIGVTGAGNGTTRPFDAVYYALTQSNASTGYTANSNITKTGSGGVTYSNVSATVGKVERGLKWNKLDGVAIAHPAFAQYFRDIVGSDGHPIFQAKATASGIDRLFGLPILWSEGARTSATASDSPPGNPLLIVCNKRFLILGKRSGPESMLSSGPTGAGYLTDETVLKLRARRAFAVGHEKAIAILEVNNGQ